MTVESVINYEKFKNTTWCVEISNDLHIKKLDDFGNFVVCRVCNDYELGTGKIPPQTRISFSKANCL